MVINDLLLHQTVNWSKIIICLRLIMLSFEEKRSLIASYFGARSAGETPVMGEMWKLTTANL